MATDEAARARDAAAAAVQVAAAASAGAQAGIDDAEQGVEQARGDVYALINTVTALTTAIEHAAAERERAAAMRARLEVESADLRTELGRAVEAKDRALHALQAAQAAVHAAVIAQAAHEDALAQARSEHQQRERAAREREHDLAGQTARLLSLEEMDAARTAFGDGARMLLAGAHDAVGQHGALADYLDVDPRFERAVEAVLGELLQHVVVDRHSQAHAGFALVRGEDAGRCGFIVTGAPPPVPSAPPSTLPERAVLLSSVVSVTGPFAHSLRAVIGDAVIVPTLDEAAALAATLDLPVVTTDGEVYRGPHVVSGGSRTEARGILATKREIKDLRDEVVPAARRSRPSGMRSSPSTRRLPRAPRRSSLPSPTSIGTRRRSWQPRPISSAPPPTRRGSASAPSWSRPRPAAPARRLRASTPARPRPSQSIDRLAAERAALDAALADAQRRLADARDDAQSLSQRAAEPAPSTPAWPSGRWPRSPRCSGSRRRRASCPSGPLPARRDVELMRTQRTRLIAASVEGQRLMDDGVRALEDLREEVLRADDETLVLKAATERQEQSIRDARRALDAVRALAAELDVSRATAEADLTHLAQQSLDAVQADLDAVAAEVAEMERQGIMAPDARAIRRAVAEPDDDDADEASGGGRPRRPRRPRTPSPAWQQRR